MKLIRETIRWSVTSLVLILVIGTLADGWRGALGGSLGVVLTDLDLLSLGFLTTVFVGPQPLPNTIRMCLLFILMKLPILAAGVGLVAYLGMSALACFLGGLGLVYFALVFVAVRGANERQQDPFS